jgi:uncharacterized protein YabN with tetrapyrrole methylase and pyrophosphatase domain
MCCLPCERRPLRRGSSETALAGAARKFEKRFRQREKVIGDSGRELETVPQSEKDHIWESIKTSA